MEKIGNFYKTSIYVTQEDMDKWIKQHLKEDNGLDISKISFVPTNAALDAGGGLYVDFIAAVCY